MNIKYLSVVLFLAMAFSCKDNNVLVSKLNELHSKNKWAIIYSSGGNSLYAFSFKNEDAEIYIDKDSFINQPSLSSDGKTVVFSTQKIGEENSDIFEMSSDGTERRKLFSYKFVKGISLSPDRKKMAFWGDYDDFKKSKNLYIYDIGSNKMKLLKKNATYSETAFAPSWSPDSMQLVYSSLDGFITAIDIRTMLSKKLTDGDAPSWSPDGKIIIYREGRSYFKMLPDEKTTEYFIKGHKYYAIDPKGENKRIIFDGKPYVGESASHAYAPVVWSPDGKYIIFFKPYDSIKEGTNRSRIYIMDIENKKIIFIKQLPVIPAFSWNSSSN